MVEQAKGRTVRDYTVTVGGVVVGKRTAQGIRHYTHAVVCTAPGPDGVSVSNVSSYHGREDLARQAATRYRSEGWSVGCRLEVVPVELRERFVKKADPGQQARAAVTRHGNILARNLRGWYGAPPAGPLAVEAEPRVGVACAGYAYQAAVQLAREARKTFPELAREPEPEPCSCPSGCDQAGAASCGGCGAQLCAVCLAEHTELCKVGV